jgi:hypothetical protein
MALLDEVQGWVFHTRPASQSNKSRLMAATAAIVTPTVS